MTRLEKVLSDREALRKYVLERCCPHDFKMKDNFSFSGCQISCDDCWNKEIEGDPNGNCNFLVKDGEAPKMLDLDKHDDGIRKLLLSICKMSYADLESAFGARNLENILRDHTISEIQKMYDEWKKPKVGDEVDCIVGYGFKGIILDTFKHGENEYAKLLVKNDEAISKCPLSNVEKTGRHFDNISIDALAEYMGAKSNSSHF